MDLHSALYETTYSKFPFTYSQLYFKPALILPRVPPPPPPPRIVVTDTTAAAAAPPSSSSSKNQQKKKSIKLKKWNEAATTTPLPLAAEKHVTLNTNATTILEGDSRRRSSSSKSAVSKPYETPLRTQSKTSTLSSPIRRRRSLSQNDGEQSVKIQDGSDINQPPSAAQGFTPNQTELPQEQHVPATTTSFTEKLKNFFLMRDSKRMRRRKSTAENDTPDSARKSIKKQRSRRDDNNRQKLLEQQQKAAAAGDVNKLSKITAKLRKIDEADAKRLKREQTKQDKQRKLEDEKLRKKQAKLDKKAQKLANNPKAAAREKARQAKNEQKQAEKDKKNQNKAKKSRRSSTAGKVGKKSRDKKDDKKRKKNGKKGATPVIEADEENKPPEDPASWLYPLLTRHEISQLRAADAELFAFCLPERQNREPSAELLEQLAQVQEERRQAKLAEEAELAGAVNEDGDVEAGQSQQHEPPAEGEDEQKPPEEDEVDLLAEWRQSQQIELENNVAVQKELISAVKGVPWALYRKLKLLRLSRAYVEQSEGQLSRGSAAAEDFARRWKQFKRLIANLMAFLVPWNSRIKEVESRFGSFVSGYFVFTRWMFFLNLFLLLVTLGCVVLPEYIVTRVRGRLPDGRWEDNALEIRKEDKTDLHLSELLSFTGPILISPFYYGYYSQAEDWLANYNIPLSYFAVYILLLCASFYLILQRMAQNTKNERLSDSSEQYTFSWRMFVSWDYLIANGDSADNKIAAIQTSFKEAISEVIQLEKKMNFWVKWGRRMLAHLLWIGILALVVYSQQLAASVNRNAEARERNGGKPVQVYERYLNNLLTMFWPAAGPVIFENIQRVDAYHPRTQAQVTLFRLVGLVGINVYGFISAGLTKVSITASNNTRLQPFLGPVFTRNATHFGPGHSIPLTLLPHFEPTTTTTINPLEYVFQKEKPSSSETSENSEHNNERQAEERLSERQHEEVEKSGEETGETKSEVREGGGGGEHGGSEEERKKKEEEEELNKLCKNCRLPEYVENAFELRELCWENDFGKEMLEQVYLDSLKTIGLSLITGLGRTVFVRYAHSIWCWDLESGFPGYEEFKTGEAILEHIQVQFFVWIGAFFAPGVLSIGVVRLVLLMYFKSWLCNVSNVPSESVFRAGSANFYYVILLAALFIVTLIMGWLVVIVPPSFHCGPFSEYSRIYEILADRLTRAVQNNLIGANGTVVATTKAPPRQRNATDEKPQVIGTERIYEFVTGPGFIIPIIVLLMLIIWYLLSSRGVLNRVNRDLKRELEVERTEGKRKVYAIAGGTATGGSQVPPPQGGMAALQATTAHDERRRSFAQVFRDVVPTEPSHSTANLDEMIAPSNDAIGQTLSAHRKSLLVGGLFSFESAARKPLSSAEVKTVAQQIIDIFGKIQLDEPEVSDELAKEEEEAAEVEAKRKLHKEQHDKKHGKKRNKHDKTLATIHEEENGETADTHKTDRAAKNKRDAKPKRSKKPKKGEKIQDEQPKPDSSRRRSSRIKPMSVTIEDETGRNNKVKQTDEKVKRK